MKKPSKNPDTEWNYKKHFGKERQSRQVPRHSKVKGKILKQKKGKSPCMNAYPKERER